MLREVDIEKMPSYQIGMERGRDEGVEQERRQIAINCINQGMALDSIIKITGLSKDEIQDLMPPKHH
jgi:hypothetical protein